MTQESRTQISVSMRGKIKSEITRIKLSISKMGHFVSTESRTKMSLAHIGHLVSPETRAKTSASNWKGGKRVSAAKRNAKRRTLGFVLLNPPFPGCEGHHVDNEQVINMPHKLHRSIYHNQQTGQGMAKINAVAYNYLFKQEVEAAMAARES